VNLHREQKLKFVAPAVTVKLPYESVDRPYVGLEHIQPWIGKINFDEKTSPEGTVSLFEPNDVLFGKLRPYLAKVALADFQGACSTEALVLRPQPGHWAPYIRYVLSQKRFIDEVDASTFGAKMPRASWEFIGSRKVPTPDLATQQAIAAFLDRETAHIDQLIRKKARFSALADERWRATLDAEILGRAIAGKRSLTDGQPYISDLPADWVLTPLKHLVDPRRPVMYGIVLPGPNVEDGVMIVKGGDVKPDRLSPDHLCKTAREIEAGYVRSRLRGGDLVIAIRGSVGDVEIIPAEIEGANLTQDAARIAPRRGVLNHWLRFALQAPSVFAPLEAGTNGAAVRGINIFDLDRVLVPTPPTAEQPTIAERLGVKEQQIIRMREKIAEHAELIRELRAALITAAVTGQIDVATWRKRGTTDQRLNAIEADITATQPERQHVRA
jgi:type I restriction enzyme, S subunit